MNTKLAGRMGFTMAGVGFALFIVSGLMPGVYIGGLLGLNIATLLGGSVPEPTVLQRVLAAAGMLAGFIATGFIFVTGGGFIGWFLGLATDRLCRSVRKKQRQIIPLQISTKEVTGHEKQH